jgi:D-sedoheptulose 7-phosphate isomerase
MNNWIAEYIARQKAALDSIPVDGVKHAIHTLQDAWANGKQIFVFGNGGNAANASHFATDLGKGSSDKLGRRFRVTSLAANVSWLTAIGNDYSYDDIFLRQLENFGAAGDIAIGVSVSGNSPNCVKAIDWANKNGLITIALVGAKRGRMAEIARQVMVVNEAHYGRAEDAQMGILHMLCYAFMELPKADGAGWPLRA